MSNVKLNKNFDYFMKKFGEPSDRETISLRGLFDPSAYKKVLNDQQGLPNDQEAFDCRIWRSSKSIKTQTDSSIFIL
jgi:hypothetical protein